MTPPAPVEDVLMEEDEAYVSSEDEDFDPSTANADENVSSSSEDEDKGASAAAKGAEKRGSTQHRRKKSEDEEDLGFQNSGDEATIKKGTKRKRKGGEADEDSGGEGGFVKTRSMRAVQEQESKKPLATASGATIDVEALWKSMNLGENAPITSAPLPDPSPSQQPLQPSAPDPTANSIIQSASSTAPAPILQPTTTHRHPLIAIPLPSTSTPIHRTVLASSPAALAYLSAHPNAAPLPRSIPRRRVSAWDPNPKATIRGLPADIAQTGDGRLILLDSHSNLRLKHIEKGHLADWPAPPKIGARREYNWRKRVDGEEVKRWKLVEQKDGGGGGAKEGKMNVVDKSKLDWEAHVEEEGAREELEQARKGKGNYLERKEFLERAEERREEDLRGARLKK